MSKSSFSSNGSDENLLLGFSSEEMSRLLWISVFKANLTLMVFLLRRGANPNVVSFTGFTPLGYVAKEGNFDFVRILLEHGAELDLCDDFEMSPWDYVLEKYLETHERKIYNLFHEWNRGK